MPVSRLSTLPEDAVEGNGVNGLKQRDSGRREDGKA